MNLQFTLLQNQLNTTKQRLLNEVASLDLSSHKCHNLDLGDASSSLAFMQNKLAINANKQQKLKDVIQAMKRLESKHAFLCDECSASILQRLTIIPEAHLCVRCQQKMETQA